MIDLSDYDEFTKSQWKGHTAELARSELRREMAYCALGIGGEAGECVDAVKKLMRGTPIKAETIAKELGDVMYYVSQMARLLGYTTQEIIQMNKDKLELRNRVGKENEAKYNLDGTEKEAA